MTAPNTSFHRDVERVAKGFDAPLAIVAARGPHLQSPADSRLKMLVPFTGAAVSRRAAEVAVALARDQFPSHRALCFPWMQGGSDTASG